MPPQGGASSAGAALLSPKGAMLPPPLAVVQRAQRVGCAAHPVLRADSLDLEFTGMESLADPESLPLRSSFLHDALSGSKDCCAGFLAQGQILLGHVKSCMFAGQPIGVSVALATLRALCVNGQWKALDELLDALFRQGVLQIPIKYHALLAALQLARLTVTNNMDKVVELRASLPKKVGDCNCPRANTR